LAKRRCGGPSPTAGTPRVPFLSISPMRLTFVTDLGQTYVVEIDPKMELENVMALLEAEVSESRIINVSSKLRSFPCNKSGISVAEQSISYDGRELSNVKSTMEGLGVSDDAMLLIRRKVSVAGRCAS
jgi:hypothetical protein